MRRKKIRYVETDYRVTVCADILAGCARQLRLADGTYYSDRNLVPLVLMPRVTLVDPSSGEIIRNASSRLTNGAWHRLDQTTGENGISSSTLISSGMTGTGTDGTQVVLYEIDTSPGSATYGRLTVRENVEAGNPVTFVFEGRLPNGRVVGMSVVLETEAVTSGIPKICFDNNPRGLYNPVGGKRYFTLTPTLLPDNGLDAEWSWESFHEGSWGALGSTVLDWAVRRSGPGIEIDRKVMQDSLRLRVNADVIVNGVRVRLSEEVSHTRRLPHVEFEPVGIGDMARGTSVIQPRMMVKVGDRLLDPSDADALEELDICWYGRDDARVASSELNPSIAVSSLGADLLLGYDVRDRGGRRLLAASDGSLLVDSEGRYIISNQ